MSLIQTLREPKIGPFAVFDITTALAGMWILAPHLGVSRERALWAAVPVGVATHALLGIDTPLNRMVFGKGHPLTKAAVAGMAYMAVRRA